MDWSESLEQDGFTILPSVFSRELVDALSQEITRLSPVRSRAGVRHALQLEPVFKIAGEPSLIEIAYQALGPRAFPFRATLFEKLPTANWLVAWHQDTALPLVRRVETPGWGPWSVKGGVAYAHAPAEVLSRVLALRVHLDDSLFENGPLRVLPGTHGMGLLDDERLQALGESIPAVDCVAPRGGVIAMKPLIVHASSKSQSEVPRRVLHIEYAASHSIADPLQLATT